MSVLRFKMDATLKQIIAWTRTHGKCRVPYSDPPEYGPDSLTLVHDDGVYLMSGSKKRQLAPGGAKCLVQYAEGLDPRKDKDVWEMSRYAVGGDDFAEPLPLEWFVKAMEGGATEVRIKMSETSVTFNAVYPKSN